MATREDPPTTRLSTPHVPIHFVPAKAGEIIKLGSALTLRVMEDGSHTDNRLGAVELIIPPRTSGPPLHWHEMHDETFLVTKGTVRFHYPVMEGPGDGDGGFHADARVGDYVVVGTRAPHTFSNPFGEEARFFNTFTPAFYVNYFKLMAELLQGGEMTPEVNMQAMASYATIPVEKRG
ncbi:hypothetical protein HO133_003188 [Letharia lupina]|uniref:Cupin type-2 domain-containing protein n=1 Tax=Letharia lupina TaxID=560253 RepID=A0A8H6CC68_9LECA|nr:uncharacterized protein HO133_003188 [Letharia lupina]KAF6220754.1 hypothetical protein HO133_003188 [Letharia lupina]